jgi:hypothetical protein
VNGFPELWKEYGSLDIMIAMDVGWQVIPSTAKHQGIMKRERFGWRGITDSGKNIYLNSVNLPARQGAAWAESLTLFLRI